MRRALVVAAMCLLAPISSDATSTVRGDANGNGSTDPLDIFHMVNYFYSSGALDSLCRADANSDLSVTTADINFLTAHFFQSGPGPTQASESCNAVDDDCDGQADEDFTSKGQLCSVGIGACQSIGTFVCTVDGSGTTCSAQPGSPAAELCNNIDDDCDGQTDEPFPNKGEPCTSGLGACQRSGTVVCNDAQTGTTCNAVQGSPTTEVCNNIDDNCDGTIDEGYRNQTTGLYDRDFACGNCFTDCTQIYSGVPNASGACFAGGGAPQCGIACSAGAYDFDDSPSNGCEFVLDNAAIYVSTTAPGANDDSTCGLGPATTGAGRHPCATITQGIARANAMSRSKVLVADGTYNEAVTLVSGRSVLGGYSPDTWQRHVASTNTIIQGVSSAANHDRTVIAAGVTGTPINPVVFEGFVVRGSINSKPGGNSYAIYVSSSNDTFIIRNNVIQAGRGGPGAAGTIGPNGVVGPNGAGRSNAATDSTYDSKAATGLGTCNTSNYRQAINGATNACLVFNGGNGGNGGGNQCPTSPNFGESSGIDGFNGIAGDGAGGGAPGVGGDAGDDAQLQGSGTQCIIPVASMNGANGAPGAPGAPGAIGTGCVASSGTVSGGHWMGAVASNGYDGSNGGGGGGGGAGGGARCVSCTGAHDVIGAQGGGGGAGACGGIAGGHGVTGGGSFGIFIVGGSAPGITDNVIVRGEGGSGGNGGAGGVGGRGGSGGAGGRAGTTSPDLFCSGAGGRGGNGGDGGAGSGGGGGCGGSTFGVYTSAVSGAPDYCNAQTTHNTISGGTGGQAGQGGVSLGNPGGNGETGAVVGCSYNN